MYVNHKPDRPADAMRCTVPMDDLDEVGLDVASEYEQMAGERFLLQYVLHQRRRTVDALAHVDKAKCPCTFRL